MTNKTLISPMKALWQRPTESSVKIGRRGFLKSVTKQTAAWSIAGSGGLLAPGIACAVDPPVAWEDRDRYGGYTGIRFKPTGFFRLEKTDRWWLVTPEGNAFLSFGINHVRPEFLMRPYNMEYWTERFGVSQSVSLDSFWRNKRAGIRIIRPGFQKKVEDDMKTLGMNTLGPHSPTWWYQGSVAPYIHVCRFVDISHYMTPDESDFLDVFSDEFVAHCEAKAREIVIPKKEDPYLLGYSMTDCPVLTDYEALPRDNNIFGKTRIGLPTWPRVLRNLGSDRPGKATYVRTMRRIYRDEIAAFNRTYLTAFKSFDELLRARSWRPLVELGNRLEARDNQAFLLRILDRCYEVEVAAIRRFDAHHLIFGDKFNGNTDVPDEVIAVMGKHFDVGYFQYYAGWHDLESLLDRFARLTGKPSFQGDSCYSAPKPNLPNPYGPHCVNQEVRAANFTRSFRNAFARKDFVGWCWCGWLDHWVESYPDKQHAGIQDAFGKWDQPIRREMEKFSAAMYSIAAGLQANP